MKEGERKKEAHKKSKADKNMFKVKADSNNFGGYFPKNEKKNKAEADLSAYVSTAETRNKMQKEEKLFCFKIDEAEHEESTQNLDSCHRRINTQDYSPIMTPANVLQVNTSYRNKPYPGKQMSDMMLHYSSPDASPDLEEEKEQELKKG
jgi:hypothetical protein